MVGFKAPHVWILLMPSEDQTLLSPYCSKLASIYQNKQTNNHLSYREMGDISEVTDGAE